MYRSALLALAARAEAGGDEALSDDVWRALGNVHWTGDLWHHPDKLGPFRLGDLQTSLDAQAELPGRIVTSHFNWNWRSPPLGDHWFAEADDGLKSARAPTEPLARLSALLRAMAAAKEDGDGE